MRNIINVFLSLAFLPEKNEYFCIWDMSTYRYVSDYKLFEEYLKEFPDHIQKYTV